MRDRRKRNRRLLLLAAILIIIVLVSISLAYFLNAPKSAVAYSSTPQVGDYTIEYPTHSGSTSPNGIALNSAGDVWFSLENDSSIAELFPGNGTIHEYRVPGLKAGDMVTWGMVVDDSTGLVWFTEQVSNSVWSFSESTHVFNQYKLSTPGAFPFGITVDAYHNIWFAELFGNKIGEISSTGTLTEHPVPISGTEPSGITTDSSGKVWFTLPGINSIGSFSNGTISIDNLTGLVTTPVGIAVDSKGNIWMTQHGPSFISEFNPQTHYFETISTSNNSLIQSLPYFCWIDQNGNVWFNEHQGNAMSEFLPQNNTLIEYFIPSAVSGAGNISYMLTSTLTPSGEPWYTEWLTGKVGTINITRPLDVNLQLVNYSSPEILANGSSLSLQLNASSSSSVPSVNFKSYAGNFTGNFSFAFSPESGTGNFSPMLTIQNNGSPPGVYFFTLTARSEWLAVSKIIEIKVP